MAGTGSESPRPLCPGIRIAHSQESYVSPGSPTNGMEGGLSIGMAKSMTFGTHWNAGPTPLHPYTPTPLQPPALTRRRRQSPYCLGAPSPGRSSLSDVAFGSRGSGRSAAFRPAGMPAIQCANMPM